MQVEIYPYPSINIWNRCELISGNTFIILLLFQNVAHYNASSLQGSHRSFFKQYNLTCLTFGKQKALGMIFLLKLVMQNKCEDPFVRLKKIRLARWKFILTLNQIQLFSFLSPFIFIFSFKLFNKTRFRWEHFPNLSYISTGPQRTIVLATVFHYFRLNILWALYRIFT